MSTSIEAIEAKPHYKVAGQALIGLGMINALVASYFLMQSNPLGFIDSKMMMTFGVAFVATGYWMISTSHKM